MNAISTKITLDKEDVPKEYVNILPYLQSPLPPPLDPKTEEPVGPEALMAIFAEECVRQEMSEKKRIPIPEPVREALIHYSRPTPLQRARRLERALDTPAKIYFKREDVSPSGSHKLNTALAQAYYAKKEGVERLATETGAGQWGSAVSLACEYFDLEAMVYMVRVSYDQKEHRGTLMRVYGGQVIPSPSDKTEFGNQILADNPNHPGTLGIAISEALEDTLADESTKYTLGSVLNHVLLQQTVIGQETIAQLELLDEKPDALVGCVGGGSNFAGMIYPFIADGRFENADLIAVEPVACPTLTKGEYRYDFGDTAGITPKLKMYTLGKDFTPPGIHAGGLRYHGCAPSLSALRNEERIKPVAYEQIPVLESGVFFAKQEGIIPAPESAHAVKAAIDLAREAKANDEEKTIVFNLSGHGQFDMGAYRALMIGELEE
ncbi:MAG: TrpB-like pyridoxal phosphate-dependent enzyme [Candidatus Thorarchaeota archaeon]